MISLLDRPENWTDPREKMRAIDTSKVRRYTSEHGFEYWLDVVETVIRTSHPEIYMSFHSYNHRDYRGHSYAKLYFDGCFVTITQDSDDPSDVLFFPDFSERTKEGEQIWHVDQLFREFDLPDNEKYPWAPTPSELPVKTIRGFTAFKDSAQQEKFINLVTTLLSCYSGALGKAINGEVTKGKVVFGDQLKKKFASGELIE